MTMLRYAELDPHTTIPDSVDFNEQIVPMLVRTWLDDYDCRTPRNDIVTVSGHGFSHLFDIASGRLIAAWGVSQGRASHERDAKRMARHPNSYGPVVHRGHAIPHRLGGGLDINLVPQLGTVNIGPFRTLEIEATRSPGSLYFTYWKYSGNSQRPVGVEQGLLIPGQRPRLNAHAN